MTVFRISATPSNISVIQVYASTTAAPDEEIKGFYSALEETLVSLTRSEIKLLLGDFNAKVEKTDSSDAFYGVVGSHGLGIRNERADRQFDFE